MLPGVWSVPPRNLNFVGRDELLVSLRDRLHGGSRVVVQALHGWGGVGKTQLAIEYAHRFVSEYDIVWWVDAEHPDLIGNQLAALAVDAGAAHAAAATADALAAIMHRLRTSRRWLLIFDNAENPESIRNWLPGGLGGHVIITSRRKTWSSFAESLDVDVFARAESTALLVGATGITEKQADELAEALGDLPLAMAQAAGLLAATRLPARQFVAMLADQAQQALGLSRPPDYPVPLAASVRARPVRLAPKRTK